MPAPISLLHAAPALGRRLPEGVGHLRVLRLLPMPAGSRTELGTDVVALIVIDGLLCSDAGTMAGPEDVVAEPGTGWVACTPVRLALAGDEFTTVAGEWPGTSAALIGLARQWHIEFATGDALEERVRNLLWRLAGRCGVPDGLGMTVPLALDVFGLAQLTGARPADVSSAVTALAHRGLAERRPGAGWHLYATAASPAAYGHSRARRDELRARAAQQLALARQVTADTRAVMERAKDLRAARSWRG